MSLHLVASDGSLMGHGAVMCILDKDHKPCHSVSAVLCAAHLKPGAWYFIVKANAHDVIMHVIGALHPIWLIAFYVTACRRDVDSCCHGIIQILKA